MENVVETMDRSRRDHSTPRLRISSRIDRSRNARRRRRPPDHGKLIERGFRCAATVVSSRDESARDRRLVKYRRNVRSLRIVKKCALIPAAIFRTILYTSRTRVLSRLVPRSNRIGELHRLRGTRTKTSTGICAGAFDSPTTDITYTVAVLHARRTQMESLRGSVANRR